MAFYGETVSRLGPLSLECIKQVGIKNMRVSDLH